MDLHPKRRIFINKGDERFQIFSFRQEEDGSIYATSPTFADAKWISFRQEANGIVPITTEAIGGGKLSVHGSGITGVRNNDDPRGHQLRVKGNHLLNKATNEAGVRHLFTIFMDEPKYLPSSSPAFNRLSDYAMQANEDLRPFVLVFFAIPLGMKAVNFQFSLQEDEMNNIPNNFLGAHSFNLRHHSILWFAYRTKDMDKWPKYTHYSYQDGYHVPIFIGTGVQRFRLEFRKPQYSIVDGALSIDCSNE